MARLYFRIYLAVLGSIVLFALLAGVTWRLMADFDRFGPRYEFFQAVAERIAPSPELSREEQGRELQQWRARSGYDLAIFGPDGALIADASDGIFTSVDRLPGAAGHGHWRRSPWVHVMQLPDGRTLAAARPRSERSEWRRFGWLAALLGIALAVGIAAYPVVRRLTRRLETLQQSVAALGAGNLAARVKVEGKDEIARLAETFNRAADRIETLVNTNRSLLANASHELRSPLARLRMGIETLPEGASDAARAELGKNIRELDQLIEEILLASRLDAAEPGSSVTEPVDLIGLAAEECSWSDAALHIETGTLPIVQADPRLLKRLLRNLIENAQRHGGGGPPDVTIHAPRDGRIDVDVCDRGPGVPEGERERIFEPFYRAAGTRERDGGVGLGLALVRQIAERSGGSVICLPRAGGGSCFRVTLPCSQD